MNIQQIHSEGVTWVNVGTPGVKELDHIGSLFPFDRHDLKECLPPSQRPKLTIRDHYLFAILQFPVYNRDSRRIEASEIDFFITKTHLVMIHESRLETIIELFDMCLHSTHLSSKHLISPLHLLTSILEQLFESLSPMLNHLSLDIDSVEQRLFEGHNREVINEILMVKRNIANYKKIMQAHKAVLEDLVYSDTNHLSDSLRHRTTEVVRKSKEIWESLKNYDDAISAIHDSHASLVSVRQSEIVKTLTVISVITFPLTLVAATFAMHPKGGMPFVNHPQGYWIVFGILVVGAMGMLVVFRKKKWI